MCTFYDVQHTPVLRLIAPTLPLPDQRKRYGTAPQCSEATFRVLILVVCLLVSSAVLSPLARNASL